jgi:hypothetical protein
MKPCFLFPSISQNHRMNTGTLSMATAWAREAIMPSQSPRAMASVFSPFQEIIGIRSCSMSHGSRHEGKTSAQE